MKIFAMLLALPASTAPAFPTSDSRIRVLRGFAASSLSVGIGAAIELAVRPRGGSPDEIAELVGQSDTAAVAQAFFAQAQEDLKAERYQGAVDGFTKVMKLTPRSYTLCMKSLLGRRDAYFGLGLRDLAGQDNRQEFGWGRGIRWPGWYIIAIILFRNEIVRDK